MGPPLFEALIGNSMFACVTLMCFYIGTAQLLKCMGGLKTGPSRGHRIQPAEGPFLDLRAKETCFKKGVRKLTRLKSKIVPPGGSSFGPVFFFCSNASMASAGSLYKLLLVVLINAKLAPRWNLYVRAMTSRHRDIMCIIH